MRHFDLQIKISLRKRSAAADLWGRVCCRCGCGVAVGLPVGEWLAVSLVRSWEACAAGTAPRGDHVLQ